MSNTIWKYPVPLAKGLFTLVLPRGAQVIAFRAQHADLALWAIVNPGTPETAGRNFMLRWTGDDIPDDVDEFYIGTTQLGPLVYHLFERR